MAVFTFKRFECKYILNEEQYKKILPVIEKNMIRDHYGKTKSYEILNIYFDTKDDSIIRHSNDSPYFKEKLRLRCYGVPDRDDYPCFFELKRKTGGIVTKRRAKLTLKEAKDFIYKKKMPSTDDYLTLQVLHEIDYFMDENVGVTPNIFISYVRDAYFGKTDPSLRITFDKDITTRWNDLSLESGVYGNKLLADDQHLMEIKISDSIPVWLTNVMSELGIRKVKFSKYGKEFERRNEEKKCS